MASDEKDGSDIVFLNSYSDGSISQLLEGNKDLRIISFSLEASNALMSKGLEFEYVDDFFPIKVHGALDQLAQNLAGSWSDPFEGTMDYKGVPLGKVFRNDFSYYFKDGLKCFSIATKVIKDLRPGAIHCTPSIEYGSWTAGNTMPMYSHLPRALETIGRLNGISFKTIGAVENQQSYETRREKRFLFDITVKGRNTLRQIFSRLRRRGPGGIPKVLTVMLKPGMVEIMEGLGEELGIQLVPYVQASDVFSMRFGSNVKEFVSSAQDRWKALRGSNGFLPQLSGPLAPVNEIMDIDFNHIFERYLYEIIAEVDRIGAVLEEEGIDFLLTIEDFSPRAKTRVAAARAMGVPSGVIQHGLLPKTWITSFGPPNADYNFIWGEDEKGVFIDAGFPSENLIVTGIGNMDIVHSKVEGEVELENVRKELAITSGKKVVLWATMPAHINFTSKSFKTFQEEIVGVYRTMAGRKDKEEVLIVKPHPIEPIEHYQAMMGQAGYEPIITKKNMSSLLEICDVLIAADSTVALQAMILGKPYIYLNTQEVKDFSGLVGSGVAIPALDIKDLSKALDRALHEGADARPSHETITSYLDRNAEKRDGSGIKELVNRIRDILKDVPERP